MKYTVLFFVFVSLVFNVCAWDYVENDEHGGDGVDRSSIHVTDGLDTDGEHVCSWQEQVSRLTSKLTSEQYVTTERYNTTCGFWGKKCTKTRTVVKSRTITRMVTVWVDKHHYHCCSGWDRENEDATECLKPICDISCKNGGKCVSPNTCECKDGFSGRFCQLDNDECRDPNKNDCEQTCINTDGGYECACMRGYTLNEDGKTCADINECANNPCSCQVDDGVCNATCTNTQGSYRCSCGKGYDLQQEDTCVDRNECVWDPNLCDQRCANIPGSYRCECFAGYRYNDDKKRCEDIDECLSSNGGCSDNCHNINGSYLCSCPDGFYLKPDGHTCEAQTPSMTNALLCENKVKVISCEYPKKIAIIDAFYGRFSDKVCMDGDYKSNLRCKAKDAYGKIKSCTHKTSCVLMAMSSIFGDPCTNVSKYLRVVYDCL